jgi:hypothetical protein
VFSERSDPSLYNESLFVAGVLRELELENWVEFWRVDSGMIQQEMARRLYSDFK